jgi:pyrroloquinoline quinone (PQQ) biosynthesis protein C
MNAINLYDQLIRHSDEARRHLLGQRLIQRALNGEIDRPTYLAFLHEAYHHVRHTVPLLMACGARLPDRLEWLREAVAEYIEEEIGHQNWILDDIAAAGGNPDATRNGLPSPATELMVAYAYHLIDRANPVGFFGMVHVLEGTSVALAERAADSLADSLGLPDRALRYLRSHGRLDQEHVGFFEGLVNRLTDPDDQEALLLGAERFYALYAAIFAEIDRTGARPEQRAA